MTEKVNIDVVVDAGKARSENQDNNLVLRYEEDGKASVYVLAVADGVGSLADSALASAYTLGMLQKYFDQIGHDKLLMGRFEDTKGGVASAVKLIHSKLIELAEENHVRYGTTLTLLCIIDNSYFVIQVGDSRCYLYENHVIRQITRDQTVAEKRRAQGEIIDDRREESILIQCLGTGKAEPKIYDGILTDEYMFLLNTDGLSNTLNHKTIADTIKVSRPGKEKLEELVANARLNGEKDNITAILLHHTVY